jgi:hypothetical protein
MKTWMLALVALLVLAAPAGTQLVQAQAEVLDRKPQAVDDCPEDARCVEYEGLVLQIDPSCGEVVGVVVEELTTGKRSLATPEASTTYSLRAAIFLEDANGEYVLAGHVGGSAAERFDNARLESYGCMQWSGGDA